MAARSAVRWVSLAAAALALAVFVDGARPATAAPVPRVVDFGDGTITVPFGSGGADPTEYLARYGITITDVSPGTTVRIWDDRDFYGSATRTGHPALETASYSHHNVFAHTGRNDPVTYTMRFSRAVGEVSFVRPASRSGAVFPKWSATAYNGGTSLGSVGQSGFSVNAEPTVYRLDFPAITHIVFDSNNGHFAAYNAVVIDHLQFSRGPTDSQIELRCAADIAEAEAEPEEELTEEELEEVELPEEPTEEEVGDDDEVACEEGADKIVSGVGDDVILTGADNDFVDAGPGNDTVDLGSGDDEVHLGPGNDSADLGAGNDRAFGDEGDDVISGGPGNDTITGGPGADTVMAGPGDDIIDVKDGARDKIDCGSGNDKVTSDPQDVRANCDSRPNPYGITVTLTALSSTYGRAPMGVFFRGSATDALSGRSSRWRLDCGTGQQVDTAGDPRPSVFGCYYGRPGFYEARLVINESYSSNTIVVAVEPWKLGLMATPGRGQAPLDVRFAILGAPHGLVTSWELAFGDGEVVKGSGTPPAAIGHTYREAGTYTAVLQTRALGRLDQAQAQVVVDAGAFQPTLPPPPPPVPAPALLDLQLSAAPDSGTVPLATTFKITARLPNGADRWELILGDGTKKSGDGAPPQTVAYTYKRPGGHEARLVVYAKPSGDGELVKLERKVVVTVRPRSGPNVFALDAQPNTGRVPLPVKFAIKQQLSAPAERWEISFGDGTKQSGDDDPPGAVAHTYTKPGNYNVVAKVWVPEGNGATTLTATAKMTVYQEAPRCVFCSFGPTFTVAHGIVSVPEVSGEFALSRHLSARYVLNLGGSVRSGSGLPNGRFAVPAGARGFSLAVYARDEAGEVLVMGMSGSW
jgi:PKD repeat protein